MDNIVYEALCRYFNTLEKTGYISYNNVEKLLILSFYKDFVFSDYRGILTYDDYLLIEKALDCLYGSTCLIPYPDYLKMGKLHLGDITELTCRLKNLENTDVVKVMHNFNGTDNSDITITMEASTSPDNSNIITDSSEIL